ncbi:MAG: thiamine-monophosphate kinase [Leptospiraceae bacterium]|nr:thiamine-monophosphate kinase [Leptospiraceae bacterium]
MRESDIIQLFFPDADTRRLDDCAALHVADSGQFQLHTTDSMVAGTHFRLDWSSPADLALKLVHCNLSDILSSGGQARSAFLNLGLPTGIPEDFIVEFARTLVAELERYSIDLAGGDTFRAPALFLSLHMIGCVHPLLQAAQPRGIERRGGQPGDFLYLTGTVGRSLAGLQLLEQMSSRQMGATSSVEGGLEREVHLANTNTAESHAENGLASHCRLQSQLAGLIQSQLSSAEQGCVQHHLQPRCRYDLFADLIGRYKIHAMMDISDGLFPDAHRLAAAADLCLDMQLEKIPVAECARTLLQPDDWIFSGEELELLFLSPANIAHPDIHCIGRATNQEQSGVRWFREHQPIIPASGRAFTHF